MTLLEVYSLARKALRVIKRQDPRNVQAARPGICGSVSRYLIDGEKGSIVFRRVDGTVRVELWPDRSMPPTYYKIHALPADLEREAGKMLDWIR